MMKLFANTPLFDDEGQSMLDRFSIALFLSVLGAGTLLAAWLLTQDAAKRNVVERLASATQHGNIHVLNNVIDWDSVRNNLKKDLMERKIQTSGADLPTQPEAIDELVNYYVRPGNLPMLLNIYKQGAASRINPRDFVRDAHFSGIREITLNVSAPPQLEKPWINKLDPIEMVMSLEPTGWKVKRIRPPEYMIPTSAPTSRFINKKGV